MSLNPRLSFLVTPLCALAFLFATTTAPAAPAKKQSAGTVKIEGGGSVRINGKTAGNGASLSVGDLFETTEGVIVTLPSGAEYVIDPGSKIRLVRDRDGGVKLLVISGGVHPVGTGDDIIDPLPYLAAFGFGNFSFPSIGGGTTSSTSTSTSKIPIYDANGTLVGYAVTGSNGRVLYYTNPAGQVVAFSTGPNGTPVSSVFGQGATGSGLL